MQRRQFLELTILLGAVALGARWRKSAMDGYCLNGARPRMDRNEIEKRLGKPDFFGDLSVGNGEAGTYVEYGNSKATWNGTPTLVYDSHGQVISVVGNQLTRDGVVQLQLGQSRQDCSRLAQFSPSEDEQSASLILGQERVTLTFHKGKLSRMVYFDPP